MATARITKRAVDAAKARKADSYLWDKELPDLGLRSRQRAARSISCSTD